MTLAILPDFRAEIVDRGGGDPLTRSTCTLQGALPLISDKNYLRGGSGITALEAYHAGAVRTLLLQKASTVVQPWNTNVAAVTQVCACLAGLATRRSPEAWSSHDALAFVASKSARLHRESSTIVYESPLPRGDHA